LTDFFPQLPEPPGRLSGGTLSRGHDSIHAAAMLGTVPALRHFLRVAPERVHEKDEDGRRPQRMAELLVPGGVVGGRCQKKSNILKFGVNRNLDFSMLVYVWI